LSRSVIEAIRVFPVRHWNERWRIWSSYPVSRDTGDSTSRWS